MIETLIENSLFLSDEEKVVLQEKVKTATPEYKEELWKILANEKELLISLFYEFSKRSKEGELNMLRWRLQSFQMEKIRQQEILEEQSSLL